VRISGRRSRASRQCGARARKTEPSRERLPPDARDTHRARKQRSRLCIPTRGVASLGVAVGVSSDSKTDRGPVDRLADRTLVRAARRRRVRARIGIGPATRPAPPGARASSFLPGRVRRPSRHSHRDTDQRCRPPNVAPGAGRGTLGAGERRGGSTISSELCERGASAIERSCQERICLTPSRAHRRARAPIVLKSRRYVTWLALSRRFGAGTTRSANQAPNGRWQACRRCEISRVMHEA
jgi:hypothetical protein